MICDIIKTLPLICCSVFVVYCVFGYVLWVLSLLFLSYLFSVFVVYAIIPPIHSHSIHPPMTLFLTFLPITPRLLMPTSSSTVAVNVQAMQKGMMLIVAVQRGQEEGKTLLKCLVARKKKRRKESRTILKM